MFNFLQVTLSDVCAVLTPTAPDVLEDRFVQYRAGVRERELEAALVEVRDASESTSPEHRVATAVLAQSTSRKEAVESKILSHFQHKRGRRDFKAIKEEGALEDTWSGRIRIDPASLKDAVLCILDEEHTLKLAWKVVEHKDVLDKEGKPTSIPSLTRKLSKEAMYRKYKRWRSTGGVGKVGRRTFLKVAKKITRAESKSLRALDYYLTDLLLFPCERLKNVIEDAVSGDKPLMKKLLSELGLVYKTLQHSYPKHVKTPSGTDTHNPAHNAPYALGHPEHTEATGEPCSSCVSIVRWFLERLPNAHPNLALYFDAKDMNADWNIIGHCYQKAKLWMGHSARAAVQNARIAQLRDQATRRRVRVVMDCMMKFEPEWWRESTRENYGKRGLSVHGSSVTYKRADGSTFMRHYHTAVDGNSAQDVGASLTMFELLCYNLRHDLPADLADETVDMCVQTDNAANYSSPQFLINLKAIAAQYNLTISVLIHNEAQDGKDIVDSSFAHLKRAWRAYIKDMKADVTTPQHMATASAHDTGVLNSHLDVIEMDRSRLDKLDKQYKIIKDRVAQALPSHIAEVQFSNN